MASTVAPKVMHSADPICFLAGRTSVRRPGPVSAPLARLRIRAIKGIFSSVPFNSVIPYAVRYVVGWLEWLVLVALEIVFGELCCGQRGVCDLYAVTSAFSDGDVAAPTTVRANWILIDSLLDILP